ncbi:MAG: fibronectin type III domain-containing protein [Balneolales bacterium]
MYNSIIFFRVITLFAIIVIPLTSAFASFSEDENTSEVLGLVLTWQQDPTSTMTIDWHTSAEGQPSTLSYKKVGPDEWEVDIDRDSGVWRYLRVETDEWKTVNGEQSSFPYSDRIIHRVELTGLEADTEYQFRIGENTRYRKFRTMPDNADRPVRFAAGGDVRHNSEWMEHTNRQAMRYEPDFILWGGDLSYADGREDLLYRWYDFLDIMMNTLITPDGRVIPVIFGIGNHEVLPRRFRENLPEYSQDDEHRKLIGPYYYSLFAFPGQPGYEVLDFGDYLSIILLDSGHSNPIEGVQTEWLETALADRQDVPHVFPIYHVPAYPTVRDPNGASSVKVRELWVPLFEKYKIKVAFENHDHMYKRTYPIRNDTISTGGVVYIGDGAWGVQTRDLGKHHEEPAWYLKRASADRHFILSTVHGNNQHFLVIDEDGDIIDEYPRTTHIDLDVRRLAEPWVPAPRED